MQYYSVFFTDKPLRAGTEPDYSLVAPLNFTSREEALTKAFKLIYSGAIVWKIDGPEGFHIDRAEIERQYSAFKRK